MKKYQVVIINKAISRFRRHYSAKTCSKYNDMVLEHIKNSYRHRGIIDNFDKRFYNKHAILFLIRRAKKLLIEGEYKQCSKYIAFGLKLDPLMTFLIFINVIISKFKIQNALN